jgi:hypothetical protein
MIHDASAMGLMGFRLAGKRLPIYPKSSFLTASSSFHPPDQALPYLPPVFPENDPGLLLAGSFDGRKGFPRPPLTVATAGISGNYFNNFKDKLRLTRKKVPTS